MINNLTDKDIGRWVVYHPGGGEDEEGRIKLYSNDTMTAWVVYKCANNWDKFKDYTGEGTSYMDLKFKK